MSRNLIVALALILIFGVGAFFAAGRFAGTNDATIGSVLSDNGYTEFRPASKHVPPGTLVLVSETEPLSLQVICGSDASLGMNFDTIPSSPTIATEIKAALDRDLSIDADFLQNMKTGGGLSDVTKVSLKLQNVRILEISDDLVIEQLPKRSNACREAIKRRVEENHTVTMVRAALVADVIYTATLTTEATAEVSADLQDKLAISLSSKVESTDDEKIVLVGEDLIWGIRDDTVLAKYGIGGLPPTGGSEDERRALPAEAAVEDVDIGEQARLKIPSSFEVVRYEVTPLQQVGQMDCWATVYTMLASWRDQTNYSVETSIKALGPEYLEYWRDNTGLPGGQERSFVIAAGMSAKPPAAYSLTGYVEMLKNHGPLWIITGDGISSHAKLLVGLFGPTLEEDSASYDAAVFEFIDPASGLYVYESALAFMTEFEREARHIVDTEQDDVDLRWQVLHL